jgi:hypothetical protein
MFICYPGLAQKPAVEQHAQPNQKHGHAQLIDEVHGAQVEIRGAAGVILAEEIAKGGAKIKQVFAVHIRRSWVWQGNTRRARKIVETGDFSSCYGS